MRKKFLSYIAIFSLIMGLFVMGQTNTIYADNTKLNPDDMESILNDISSVGKAWESMEFQSKNEILNSTTPFGGGIYSRTVKVYSFI